MKIKELLKGLDTSKDFQAWRKKNPASFLAHVFKMIDEANKDDWQVGFYNPDDTITTFIVTKDDVKALPEAEIFKKPDAKIMQLDMDDIKIEMGDAIEKARNLQKKEYPKELPTKEIIILQKLDIGQLYNITLVTQSFNTLNIKVDAKTGKVIKHKLISLVDLKGK